MSRTLTPGEVRLAEQVFGDAIRLDRVRVWRGGFGHFAVTIGSNLLLPPALGSADFSRASYGPQSLFVHELVHVWQFQTRPLRTLASWAKAVATGGYGPGFSAYRYALPFGRFEALGLERQASVVEHAFLLGRGVRTAAMPADAQIEHYAGAPFPAPPSGRNLGPWGRVRGLG